MWLYQPSKPLTGMFSHFFVGMLCNLERARQRSRARPQDRCPQLGSTRSESTKVGIWCGQHDRCRRGPYPSKGDEPLTASVTPRNRVAVRRSVGAISNVAINCIPLRPAIARTLLKHRWRQTGCGFPPPAPVASLP